MIQTKRPTFSLISDFDLWLFKEGKHTRLFDHFGCHRMMHEGVEGFYFALWAPHAEIVSVIGSFNDWHLEKNPMQLISPQSGVWECFIPGVEKGALYKYAIVSKADKKIHYKSDPFAFFAQVPPETASIVWDLAYNWKDKKWVENREKTNGFDAPISIYEMHMGSWREGMNYLEMAKYLPSYLEEMGFTHVEFLPIMEHPFYGSWGYQKLSYFAPSSRYGTPQEFMVLIDALHSSGIGVYLDWTPAHFPADAHGLAFFDGTYLYEYEEEERRLHPDWKTYVFDYKKGEVRSFLISSASFWADKFHADGLRVDAVASMLYHDYSRTKWLPNMFGGNHNFEAISFLKDLNTLFYRDFPLCQTIAEESSAFPRVSQPVYNGGLGFGMKWEMGWMHHVLNFFARDKEARKDSVDELNYVMSYFFYENFVLALSHDEVVYGKRHLLEKMPGLDEEKFANLRLLFAYMFFHPGKKLLFMGSEFGSRVEWNHSTFLQWQLLEDPRHLGIKQLVKDLNCLYKKEKALYVGEFSEENFSWYPLHREGTTAFLRGGQVLVLCNLIFEPLENLFIEGDWELLFSSDEEKYGGFSGSRIIQDKGGVYAHLSGLSALVLKKK